MLSLSLGFDILVDRAPLQNIESWLRHRHLSISRSILPVQYYMCKTVLCNHRIYRTATKPERNGGENCFVVANEAHSYIYPRISDHSPEARSGSDLGARVSGIPLQLFDHGLWHWTKTGFVADSSFELVATGTF